MLSLETAKNLKIAGLEWAYEYGFPKDCVYYKGKLHEVDGPGADNTFRLAPWGNYVKQDYIAFAPRLDQLLAEIEKREYAWEMMRGVIEVWHRYLSRGHKKFVTETTDEAAAQALLWIIEQEASV